MKIDNSDMYYEDLEKYKRQHRKRQKDMREVKRLTRSVERFLKQKTNVDAEQKYYWETYQRMSNTHVVRLGVI